MGIAYVIIFWIGEFFFRDYGLLRSRIYHFLLGLLNLYVGYYYFATDENKVSSAGRIWYQTYVPHFTILFGCFFSILGASAIYFAFKKYEEPKKKREPKIPNPPGWRNRFKKKHQRKKPQPTLSAPTSPK